MVIDHYYTLKESTKSLYKEKGSKFIGLAYPVGNEHDVKEIIGNIKKEYHDARHWCYAYILGTNGENTRANDDGEPNNSAGVPILNQIKSKEVTNTLVVVVRYFGGTKLGVSGLINAYKTAASDALIQSNRSKVIIRKDFHLSYSYDITNDVMRLIGEHDILLISQKFETKCSMEIALRISEYDSFLKKAALINGLLVEKK